MMLMTFDAFSAELCVYICSLYSVCVYKACLQSDKEQHAQFTMVAKRKIAHTPRVTLEN